PSSQTSVCAAPLPSVSTKPSPHRLFLHASVQLPSLRLLAPSSHSSTPAHTMPSPHVGRMQPSLQPSVLMPLLPSSHWSVPLTMPSPHVGVVHAFVQASRLLSLPSSHA